MGMNDRELAAVVADLRDRVGEPVTGAWQPSRDRVIVGLGGDQVLFVPRGPWARVHGAARRPRNPKKPFSFQGALRAHLHGRLLAVDKVDGDRVVVFRFEGDLRLLLRLTGRSGGLWLLQGDEIVAAYDGPAPAALPELPEVTPREEVPRFTPRPGETWNEAAARWFTTAERQSRIDDQRRRVAKGLKRALDRAVRLQENLERDLERADTAPMLRRQADALAAHLHEVPRGADQIALADFDDPDRILWIALDPARSAAQNMQLLYSRARRLDRVGEHVIERMEEVGEQVRRIRDGLLRVDTADPEELDALEQLCPPEPRRPDAPEAQRPWSTWTGPRGETVLVGRNAVGNRRLTFQRARGDDFWLHVRSRPGAHVIVPAAPDRPPSLERLLAAAQIALIHSKVTVGERADVQYARVRDVRSIPGEVGRVRVDNEKVLHVVRDPAALVGWTHD